ncbi:cystinosin/ERS1p repeat protein [Rhodotorula toruloides]|uniref:Cystinosin/ERS1p repeat protein n=1 Tax=Rhodotorula toruloides TaxID=5286 RepID=A0A511KG79_RHOTO|nr:cystinosin/ERS1p repeat protein [Rhodotorula toruloides]
MSRYTAEQVTGWFGTVLWCIQLVPQVYMNYRRKTTEGLSNLLCVCWMLSGVTLGIFAIVENINIPIIVQPHCYGSLCFLMLCQMLYYDRKWRWYAAAGAFAAYACAAAGFEVGMVYASRAVEDRGSKGLTMLWGILSDVFLAVGFIPQFIEIYKAREVYALSYTFLAMDSAGAVFSIVSLAMKPTLDGIAFTGYLIVLVLEIAIFILAILLNPRARRRRAALDKTGGAGADGSPSETTTHIAPEASESGMPLPSETVSERHRAEEAGGRGEQEAGSKAVERHSTMESGVTLAEEGRTGDLEKERKRGDEAV